MAATILSLAWIGAIAWPLVLLAAWAMPALRNWPARTLAAGLTVFWGLGVWAFLVEPQLLVVRGVRVESAAWRGPPLRVGLVSDVHIGPHMSPRRVARIAARMNALEPDIVLLAGDYVAGHRAPHRRGRRANGAITTGLAALGQLEAPLGVIAVLGNHDWWYDGWTVESVLTDVGVRTLENAALEVEGGEASFWVAGLADYHSERASPDWDAALAGAPAGADVIALAHYPETCSGRRRRAWPSPSPVTATAARSICRSTAVIRSRPARRGGRAGSTRRAAGCSTSPAASASRGSPSAFARPRRSSC